MPDKALLENEVLNKLYKYCAYQERPVSDVQKQLDKYGIDPGSCQSILNKLQEEGFLDEKRYARTYVLGKLRNNHWGKRKIIQGLRLKSVDPVIIHNAVGAIDDSEYLQILKKLISKKERSISDKDRYIKNHKIARYMMSKGYESNIIWDVIHELYD